MSHGLLDGVSIPFGPAAPARCSEDEWLAEMASLDYYSAFDDVLADRARANLDAPKRSARHAGLADLKRLTRSGLTIAEAAFELEMEPMEAAGILGGSADRAEKVMAVEDYLTRHPLHSYTACARTCGTAVNTVIRYAALLGKERKCAGGAAKHRAIPDARREKVKALVLASEGTPKWAAIGREVGMDRGCVFRLAKREGWLRHSDESGDDRND